MKKIFLIILLISSSIRICAQKEQNIIIGTIDSIQSNILNEQRKILIHVPQENSENIKKYPVLYLLDGDSHFTSIVGMMEQLSSNGNTILPKMIIVGITNTNRTRDLTPTKAEINPPFVNKSIAENSGGGDNFLSFLENELIPKIESEYPTEPYRIFIGHSFGGLTVMNTLANKPALFNTYIAIDPSMWWDNQNLLKEIKKNGFDLKNSKRSLFLGIANTMESGMDTLNVKKDQSINSLPIRSNLEFKSYLESNLNQGLRFKISYYENDTHGSVPLIAEYDALRYIFNFYELKLGIDEYIDPKSDIFNKIVSHYKNISEEFGYEKKPDEIFIDIISNEFLGMKQYEKAENFYKFNAINYPESFKVYNSLGDFYQAINHKSEAIENYNKSINLNKNSPSVKKLKEYLQALEKE
jgi:predicted alpha/beta superfamily hydrolase